MIKGKRIYLRAVEERDLALLLQWTNDPDIAAQNIGWTFPTSLAQQREWFAGSLRDQRTQRFVIESYEHGVIGLTGLCVTSHGRRHDRGLVPVASTRRRPTTLDSAPPG